MLASGIASARAGWHLALWDEHRAARLHTLASADELWAVLRDLCEAHPAMPVVLPSGLGIPVTRAGDLLDQDIAEMTGALAADQAERLLALLVEARRRAPRALCIPAVKLLPTIPLHRKLRRLELGTAEALCIGVWALYCLQQSGMQSDAASFLLVHRGPAGRVLLAVQGGRIADGIGELPGLLPPEAAPWTDADRHAHGPRAPFRVRSPLTLREAEKRLPGCSQLAKDESLCKEALGLAALHGLRDVVLLGDQAPEATRILETRLRRIPLSDMAAGHEAALGGALIAAGLTGGPTASLVNRLGVREARERAPDWIEP